MNNMRQGRMQIYGPDQLKPFIERMQIYTDTLECSTVFTGTDPFVTPTFRVDALPLSETTENVAYLCCLAASAGTLDIDKFVELNIPSNVIPTLKKCETVTLPDGRIISRNDLFNGVGSQRTFAGKLFCLMVVVLVLFSLYSIHCSR